MNTTLQELVALPLQRPELFSGGNLTRVRSGHLGYIYCISLFDRKEGIIRNQFRVLLCSYFIFSVPMEINSLDVVGFFILGAHGGRDMGIWLGSHVKEYYCLDHLAQARVSLQKQLPQKLVPTLYTSLDPQLLLRCVSPWSLVLQQSSRTQCSFVWSVLRISLWPVVS